LLEKIGGNVARRGLTRSTLRRPLFAARKEGREITSMKIVLIV